MIEEGDGPNGRPKLEDRNRKTETGRPKLEDRNWKTETGKTETGRL
jgi:hypothetical protein